MLIIGALYVNQVVVPATPPLFIPTPTPTRSPESFINQAEELYLAGKLNQAIEAYKEAIAADPSNTASYISLARLQVFTRQYEEAITNAQNALLQNPNNAMAYAVLGWAQGLNGDPTLGMGSLKRAIELDPNLPFAHAYYAEVLLESDDPSNLDRAISESQLARDLDPNLFEVHRVRGLVLAATQNMEEARDEFKQAIAIYDKIADVHLSLGFVYRVLGENDLAVEELLAASSLNPNDPSPLAEISLAYANEGQFGKAAQYAEQAAKIDPSSPKLHGNLGIMHYRNQELGKAIPELALAVHGGTTEDGAVVEGLPLDYGTVTQYYWFYGFALAKSNRCSEAVPIFQALLNGVPDYELAVENANAGLEICRENLENPPEETTEESAEGEEEQAEATTAP